MEKTLRFFLVVEKIFFLYTTKAVNEGALSCILGEVNAKNLKEIMDDSVSMFRYLLQVCIFFKHRQR